MENKIENQICEAIQILVDRAISQADYDKTIQATIISCEDESIGKYKVKYQDSIFYAYSSNLEIVYTENSLVYILVPNSDLKKDKTILGAVDKLGINYLPTIESIDYYDKVGNNCIEESNSEFGLCSYKEKDVRVLYSKDYVEYNNAIKINKTSLNEYIKQSDNLICGATFRNSLAAEQTFKGNFGILFSLDFLDNTGERVTRNYTINVDNMTGNPYKLLYDTRQYGIFPIDGKNFIEVNSISIFSYDFPNNKNSDFINDIFVKNVELQGANRIEENLLDGCYLSLLTRKGTYFTSNNIASDTITLEAQLKVKGKITDLNNKNLPFYWFIEHTGITFKSTYYNKYGGQGWKCLNTYNLIKESEEDESDTVEWIPADKLFTIAKRDIIAKEARYKCVTIYENNVIEKIVTIKNLDSNYVITIESDSGTQFAFDAGEPNLKCYINGREELDSSYVYSWGVTDNVNNFQTLSSVEGGIQINKNSLTGLKVNTITNFSIFQCTVYRDEIYLGTASIKITNSLESNGSYTIVINNGTQVFQYNENGVSPTNKSLENPQVIPQLTFDVYNEFGQIVDKKLLRDIKWIVPTELTMLSIPNQYENVEVDEENKIKIYKDIYEFNYDIQNIYYLTYYKNDIILQANYNGVELSAKTNLTFTKQGDIGTNGTDVVVKIVPNVVSGREIPKKVILKQNSIASNSTGYTLNYIPAKAKTFFNVQLWENGEKIFENSQSGTSTKGSQVAIQWEMLKNNYGTKGTERSCFTVNQNTGVFEYLGFDTNVISYANIARATVKYKELTYYGTIPINVLGCASGYNINIKDNTGYEYVQYAEDGTRPQYNNKIFEFEIFQNGVEINYTTISRVIGATGGSLLEGIRNLPLSVETRDLEANQFNVVPADKFDGLSIDNALYVSFYQKIGNVLIGFIHIPIHLYLNRFGHSNLNGWDGNSISIDNDGGFILAPQVGAGSKDTNNAFTGVVIGEVTKGSNNDSGLFAFSTGARSVFIDAKTGKSIFGKSGAGQIVIDPSSNLAEIYSGNYSVSNKMGMKIDLTTPYIKFGSGNFEVNASGFITAKGGGSIAGWGINNTEIFAPATGTRTLTLDSANLKFYSGNKSTAVSSLNGFYLDPNTFTLGSMFKATSDGILYIGTDAVSGNLNARKWTIQGGVTSARDTVISYGSLYGNGSVYISTSRIALGKGFDVTAAGMLKLGGDITSTSGRYFTVAGNGVTSSFISYGFNVNLETTPKIFPTFTSPERPTSSIYIGTDGVTFGKRFAFDSVKGTLRLNTIVVDNATITNASLTNVTLSAGDINNITGDVYREIKTTAQGLNSLIASTRLNYDVPNTYKPLLRGYGVPNDSNSYPSSYYDPNVYKNYFYLDERNGTLWLSQNSNNKWGWGQYGNLQSNVEIFKNETVDTFNLYSKTLTETQTTFYSASLVFARQRMGDITPEDIAAMSPGEYFLNLKTGEVKLKSGADIITPISMQAYEQFTNSSGAMETRSIMLPNPLEKTTQKLWSQIKQTAREIKLSVTEETEDGVSRGASIRLTADGITQKAEKITFQGLVTFKSLSEPGQTVINGSNITTGTISANRISGGTLTLGGPDNEKGVLIIYDNTYREQSEGIMGLTEIGRWDKNGISVMHRTANREMHLKNNALYGWTSSGGKVVVKAGNAASELAFAAGGNHFENSDNYSDCAFKVNMGGAITATSGTFSGEIQASTGSIGYYVIDKGVIRGYRSGSTHDVCLTAGANANNTAIAAGVKHGTADYTAANFRVRMDGTTYIKNLYIGANGNVALGDGNIYIGENKGVNNKLEWDCEGGYKAGLRIRSGVIIGTRWDNIYEGYY